MKFNLRQMVSFPVKQQQRFVDVFEFRREESFVAFFVIRQLKSAYRTFEFLKMVGHIPHRHNMMPEKRTPHFTCKMIGFFVCHGFVGLRQTYSIT